MTLRLNGDSGYVEIAAPSSAGSNTLVLPNGNGTSGQYLQTDGLGALSWQTVATSNITYSTAQATTSGSSSIQFTDVPTGVKKITVIFDNVSTDTASSLIHIQLSTGGTFLTSGYTSTSIRVQAGAVSGDDELTTGLLVGQLDTNPGRSFTGAVTIHNVTGNRWLSSGTCVSTATSYKDRAWMSGGFIDVGGAIDKLQVEGHTSAYNWDGGQINVMYEV